MARVLCRYTSPTWRVRSATVQPGQLGTAAVGSVGTTARRRAKSAARQSRNREYSMPDSPAHAHGSFSPSGGGPPCQQTPSVLQKRPQTCLQRAQRQGRNLLPPSVIYVSEILVGFLGCPPATVGTPRDTGAGRGAHRGGVMSDLTASLRDSTGVLGVALVQWADRNAAPDKAAARRAGTTAVDAIDAMLRDLFVLRGRLVQEIRQADGAAGGRVA